VESKLIEEFTKRFDDIREQEYEAVIALMQLKKEYIEILSREYKTMAISNSVGGDVYGFHIYPGKDIKKANWSIHVSTNIVNDDGKFKITITDERRKGQEYTALCDIQWDTAHTFINDLLDIYNNTNNLSKKGHPPVKHATSANLLDPIIRGIKGDSNE